MLVASRVPQTPSSSRSPGSGGTNGSAPVATHDVLGGVADARRPRPRRCRPAGRCRAAGRCRGPPASAPGRRRSSSDTMKSRHASAASTSTSARRPGLARALHRLARAQQASSTECTPSRSTRRRPALARRRRRAVRGRPAPRRSARRARRRRGRSRRSRCSSSSSPPSVRCVTGSRVRSVRSRPCDALVDVPGPRVPTRESTGASRAPTRDAAAHQRSTEVRHGRAPT